MASTNKDNALSIPGLKEITSVNPNKVETYGGKNTARVTKSYDQPDGSTVKIMNPRKRNMMTCKQRLLKEMQRQKY